MAIVTGYTADRMQAIEDETIVDASVVGGNLILTRHDGTTVNAGSVIGPQGDPGPVGSDLSVLAAASILEVGQSGQIKAGRQLAASDFTNMGLAAPIGLWNLSNLNDSSGNGRALSNKGAVPFDVGINGLAASAAKQVGSTTQVLYIVDTGANDPFRLKTGSFGCWIKSPDRDSTMDLISKMSAAAGNYGYFLSISASGQAFVAISLSGSDTFQTAGTFDVTDDKWHFLVATYDGTKLILYVDGVLDSLIDAPGSIFQSAAPFNIGGRTGDASTAVGRPFSGRIDEAFITSDVLNRDEIRNLYSAKIAHTLAAVPGRASITISRRRRGAALVAGDFPTQPLRLYNFSGGSLGDEGSAGTGLTNNNGAVAVAGGDGFAGNAFNFKSTSSQSLSATDAGLPAGTSSRSFGAWFKTLTANAFQGILAWGLTHATNDGRLAVSNAGLIVAYSGGDSATGPFVADGRWHHAVVVEYNAVGGTTDDGIKRKLYLDGQLVAVSTVLNAITLGGANKLRIGSNVSPGEYFNGQIDTAFICNYVLTAEQIWTLYNKSSQQLAVSPKNSGDHIEAMDATSLLAIFDELEGHHKVTLEVAA